MKKEEKKDDQNQFPFNFENDMATNQQANPEQLQVRYFPIFWWI